MLVICSNIWCRRFVIGLIYTGMKTTGVLLLKLCTLLPKKKNFLLKPSFDQTPVSWYLSCISFFFYIYHHKHQIQNCVLYCCLFRNMYLWFGEKAKCHIEQVQWTYYYSFGSRSIRCFTRHLSRLSLRINSDAHHDWQDSTLAVCVCAEIVRPRSLTQLHFGFHSQTYSLT